MNELDKLLKDSPTLKVYEAVNKLLIEIASQTEKESFNELDYKRYWDFPYIIGVKFDLNQVEVIFRRDVKGNYYFHISKYPFYNFGDHGMETCFFSKDDLHMIDLSEASIIKEIEKNLKIAKKTSLN